MVMENNVRIMSNYLKFPITSPTSLELYIYNAYVTNLPYFYAN